MTFLKTWLLSVIGTAFLVAITETLIAEKNIREIGRFAGGMLLLLALLQPLLRLQPGRFDRWLESWENPAISERKEEYQDVGKDAFLWLINKRSTSYIEASARELGREVHAEVEAVYEEDGSVALKLVRLNVPYDDVLSRKITAEFGITAENQRWQQEAG